MENLVSKTLLIVLRETTFFSYDVQFEGIDFRHDVVTLWRYHAMRHDVVTSWRRVTWRMG